MDRLSKPATKEKKGGNHEIVIGTVGASLVLACAVAMMGCSGKLSAKACQNSIPTPPGMADSVSTTKGALNSLLDTTVKLASPKVQSIRVNKKFDEVTKPSKDDVDNLKMEAVNLMKAGQGEVAAAKLWKLWKLYEQKNDPEPKHFVKMALVEILIAQGKYEEASKLLEVVPLPKGCEISDARPYLYKAILCIMNGDDKKAEIYWKMFTGQDQDDQSGGPNRREKDDPSGRLTQKNNNDQSGRFSSFWRR